MNLNALAIRAAVLKMLADRINFALRDAKKELAAELGPEGRKNAVLMDNKIASVSVTKTGRVSVTSEELLTRWVEENYPTEIEEVVRVRPAFLDRIKKTTEEAGEPCGPGGELGVPGIEIGEPWPVIRKTPGADQLIDQLWREGRLTIDGEIGELE